MKSLAYLVSLLGLFMACNSHAIRYQEVDFYDDTRKRPVKLNLWYKPANHCADTQQLCINAEGDKQGIAILSHGAMGSSRSLNWLAYPLAAKGFLVLGVNHFGESWAYGQHNMRPSAALELWQRPKDLSFVLDALIERSPFQRKLNSQAITAIGFSSGGSTVLSLAGAQYKFSQAKDYCQQEDSAADLSCAYSQFKPHKPSFEPEESGFSDPRISQVIALDPAAGHITDRDSLASIQIPTLIVTVRNNDFLPFKAHAGMYQQHIPEAQLETIEGDAGHFVFLDRCDLDIKVHGIPLCSDKDGVDRNAIQRQLLGPIFSFLFSRA